MLSTKVRRYRLQRLSLKSRDIESNQHHLKVLMYKKNCYHLRHKKSMSTLVKLFKCTFHVIQSILVGRKSVGLKVFSVEYLSKKCQINCSEKMSTKFKLLTQSRSQYRTSPVFVFSFFFYFSGIRWHLFLYLHHSLQSQ